MASVMQMKRIVQRPVSLVRSASGFALRLPVTIAQTIHPAGPSAAMNTAGFRNHRMNLSRVIQASGFRLRATDWLSATNFRLQTRSLKPGLKPTGSVVLLQIQSGVKARDLIAVAVEHQRLPAEELADAPLGRLSPPRMIDVRVHVGIEPVLLWRRFLPR